jgi:hypothetical protein
MKRHAHRSARAELRTPEINEQNISITTATITENEFWLLMSEASLYSMHLLLKSLATLQRRCKASKGLILM